MLKKQFLCYINALVHTIYSNVIDIYKLITKFFIKV